MTPQPDDRPTVSIVVPIYNVEEFLRSCLDSVKLQSYTTLEVILVDDGSPDSSADIAAEYADRDTRFKLYHFENGGLGAARNRGANLATGEYLLFLDSDDILPSHAIETMVTSLQETGSCYATGRVMRFNSTTTWRAPLSQASFNRYWADTTVAQHPDLVYDTTAWNKLFRMSFWRKGGYTFPEGKLFEDIALMARCLTEATSIDIVPETVYLWRSRDFGPPSITQALHSVTALEDRIEALEGARDAFVAYGSDAVVRSFDKKVANLDIPLYAKRVPTGDTAFITAFRDGFAPLADVTSRELPLKPEIAGLLNALESRSLPSIRRWANALAGAHRPLHILRNGDSSYGRAYLRDQASKQISTRLRKIGSRRNKPTPLRIGRVDVGSLSLRAAGMVARRATGRRQATINRLTRDLDTIDRRIWWGFDRHGLISINTFPLRGIASLAVEDDRLIIRSAHLTSRAELVLVGESFGQRLPIGHDQEDTWSVPLASFVKASEYAWRIEFVEGDSHGPLLTQHDFAPSIHSVDSVMLSLRRGFQQRLRIVRSVKRALVDLTVDGIRGTILIHPHQPTEHARLVHDHTGLTIPLESDGTNYRFEVGNVRKYGQPVPLRDGHWRLQLYAHGRWERSGCLKHTEAILKDIEAWSTYTLVSTHDTVRITSRGIKRTNGNWHVAQRRFEARSARLRALSPVTNSIVFECFYGRQVSCHPHALLKPVTRRFPNAHVYWVTLPGQTYAPPGTTPLVRWTAEWHEAMATAQLVVTNSSLPAAFVRHPNQVVLQTWHGTPLKRIGLDMVSFDHFRPGYQDEQRHQAAQWTHLLSSSEFCSSILPDAFGYSGQLLECGSPRNDLLLSPDRDQRAAEVRERLGASADTRFVLLAPTWRDNVTIDRHHADVNDIDLESLAHSLGDNITILYRAHTNVLRQRGVTETARLLNVTDYPDVADLYLVSDVMVTDYSSVMFDYSLLRRPMVFHCPDLEEYRDSLRGWYFDFAETAPGPITRTLDELRDAIGDALSHGIPATHADRFDAFIERYNMWDDGRASEKVADVLADAVRDAT